MNPEQNQTPSQPSENNGGIKVVRPTGSVEPGSSVNPQVVVNGSQPTHQPSPVQTSSIYPTPSSSAMSYSQMAATQKRGFPKWLVVVIVVILVLAGGLGGLYVLANNATKGALNVSNQFVADLQANNPTDAYNLLAPAGKNKTTEPQVAQLFNQLSPESQGTVTVKARMVWKHTGKPAIGSVVYFIGGSNGGYLQVVSQDNNPWQVLNFQVSNSPLNVNKTNLPANF